MFTATVAYLFLWTGGTALVLLGAGRRIQLPLGVAVGFGWGVGILGAALFEVVGAFEQWPVRLLSLAGFGIPLLLSVRRRLWPAPRPSDLVVLLLVALTAIGPWADAASGMVWGDASHNWYLKARALVTDGTPIPYLQHSRTTSHPGYPPVHPLSIAWVQHLRGGGWSDAAANLAGVFTQGAVSSLIGAAVAPVAGPLAAGTAVLAFAALPFTQAVAPMGDADLLLAYFLLAGVLALVAACESHPRDTWLRIASLMAVGAALTKAEGLVIVAALAVAAVTAVRGSVRQRVGAAMSVALPALIAVLGWALVRRLVMPGLAFEAGDVSTGSLGAYLVRPDLYWRWQVGAGMVLWGMAHAAWAGSFWSALGVALAWPRRWCPTTQVLCAAIAVVLCGLVLAFAATREYVSAQAAAPVPRNLLLIYPLAVVLLVLRLTRLAAPVGRVATPAFWRTATALAGALMLAAAAPMALDADDRLKGGDVEPPGIARWSVAPNASRVDAAAARRGQSGLLVDGRRAPGAMTVNRSIVARPGETLRLRYWARASSDATFRVYVEWASAATGTVAARGGGSTATESWYWGGTRWEPHEVIWTMPEGSASSAYVVAQVVRGEAAFDDFSVVPSRASYRTLASWWLAVAVLGGLALSRAVASVNVALVAVMAWTSWLAWSTASTQLPKVWARPANLTRSASRAPDHARFLALSEHADRVGPWLDPALPLAVRTSGHDARFVTTLEYLLYGRYSPKRAILGDACNVLTFTRRLDDGTPVPASELAVMAPSAGVLKTRFELGDVYLAHGDCRSGDVTKVTRPTRQRR